MDIPTLATTRLAVLIPEESGGHGAGGAGRTGPEEGVRSTTQPTLLSITHRGELRTRHVCIMIFATTNAEGIILAAKKTGHSV